MDIKPPRLRYDTWELVWGRVPSTTHQTCTGVPLFPLGFSGDHEALEHLAQQIPSLCFSVELMTNLQHQALFDWENEQF